MFTFECTRSSRGGQTTHFCPTYPRISPTPSSNIRTGTQPSHSSVSDSSHLFALHIPPNPDAEDLHRGALLSWGMGPVECKPSNTAWNMDWNACWNVDGEWIGTKVELGTC